MLRGEAHVLRRMLDAPAPGKRRRRRQHTGWKDSCKIGVEPIDGKCAWGGGGALDGTKWKNDI